MKDSKKRRKEALKGLKDKRKAELIDSLPVTPEDVRKLFDYLDDKLTSQFCDHTFTFTEEFASDGGYSFEAIESWASENGAWCDCEVLANVEQEYEFLL